MILISRRLVGCVEMYIRKKCCVTFIPVNGTLFESFNVKLLYVQV